jgi:hypothetical protein
MSYGILAGIADPEFMAKLAERRRIAEKVAAQTGVTVREAENALYEFEADLSSCGQTLN